MINGGVAPLDLRKSIFILIWWCRELHRYPRPEGMSYCSSREPEVIWGYRVTEGVLYWITHLNGRSVELRGSYSHGANKASICSYGAGKYRRSKMGWALHIIATILLTDLIRLCSIGITVRIETTMLLQVPAAIPMFLRSSPLLYPLCWL